MTSPNLSDLFRKLLNNTCSDEEAVLIVDLLADEKNKELVNKLILEQLADDSKTAINEAIKERLHDRLKIILAPGEEISAPFFFGRFKRNFFNYAAAIMLISLSTGLFYFYKSRRNAQALLAHHQSLPILPGGNKAILTLADGRNISLDQASDGEIARQAEMSIIKTNDGQLVYEVAEKAVSGAAVGEQLLNTITTPKGGQYIVVLPDGTKVWLNAASSLKYPAVFNDLERKVELSGEAYFEVVKISKIPSAKNKNNAGKNIPFIVVSNHQVIEVTGTNFNVSAYADELDVITTLLEGAVRVSDEQNLVNNQGAPITKTLKAGEQSRLSDHHLRIGPGNAETAVAWKNGKFQFENESIESIMRKIARWYDVDIDYKGNMQNKIFSGTISRYDNVNEVLKMLQLTGTINFKVNERRITVMS
ncbi:MAG: FecR family protein [Sphingobacteriaceae bacterium]